MSQLRSTADTFLMPVTRKAILLLLVIAAISAAQEIAKEFQEPTFARIVSPEYPPLAVTAKLTATVKVQCRVVAGGKIEATNIAIENVPARVKQAENWFRDSVSRNLARLVVKDRPGAQFNLQYKFELGNAESGARRPEFQFISPDTFLTSVPPAAFPIGAVSASRR
jgi:hypothetical protein